MFKTTTQDTSEGVMKKHTCSYSVIIVDFFKFNITSQQFVSFLDSCRVHTPALRCTCLSLSHPAASAKKKPTTAPLVSLHFPPKNECRCFYTDPERGEARLRFRHYVIQCITCCHCPPTPQEEILISPDSFCALWPLG